MSEKNKNLETDLFVESLYKLQKKIVSCVLTLRLERDTHVPELMTKVRILPGVAVCAQNDKVDKFSEGDTRLQISLKFLPKSDEIYKSVSSIGKMITRLPGVMTVTVDEYNKKKITLKGKKIVF